MVRITWPCPFICILAAFNSNANISVTCVVVKRKGKRVFVTDFVSNGVVVSNAPFPPNSNLNHVKPLRTKFICWHSKKVFFFLFTVWIRCSFTVLDKHGPPSNANTGQQMPVEEQHNIEKPFPVDMWQQQIQDVMNDQWIGQSTCFTQIHLIQIQSSCCRAVRNIMLN